MSERDGQISDLDIIELYWSRDETAISVTDRKYGKLLSGISFNILHDRDDCEQVKNDTYLSIWSLIPPTRPVSFPAFIVTIVRRTAISLYREKTSRHRIPSELTVSIDELSDTFDGTDSAEDAYEAGEIGKLISDYVRGLTERRRFIFIDRFYFSESVETIAAELSVSVPTVYRELERTKAGLKCFLERNGVYL